MMFVFKIHSPGHDLHDEPIEIEDLDVHSARRRAVARIRETFAYASDGQKAITTFRFVAQYPSRRAMEKATSWAQ